MEPFLIKTDDMELGCSIDEQGIIQLRVNGNVGIENEEHFLEWSDVVRGAMVAAKEKDPERVLCMIDITDRPIDVDQSMLTHLFSLMNHNRDFATRTGVYGGNFFTRSLLDVALKATGRTNMKAYDSKEEALEWVLNGRE